MREDGSRHEYSSALNARLLATRAMRLLSETLSIASLFALAMLVPPVAAIAAAPPAGAAGVVLVIGPDVTAIVHDAGGRQVGPWRARWGMLATGREDATGSFAARAVSAGAWRVTDGEWVAAICGEKVER